MLVSIIIINYNTFQYTCNCIESILKHTSISDYEIILVDNASTEFPAKIFKTKYPSLKLIENSENGGFAKGNNLGIHYATGKYILLINSDTELINDAIGKAYTIMENDTQIGVLSCQLQYPNGKIQAVAGRFPTLSREMKELFRINKFMKHTKRPFYYLGEQWDYNNKVKADWVWGAFFMFKKSDLQYFPEKKLHETFFMYGEDVQWCYHFKYIIKKEIEYHPEPKAIHYIGGSEKNKAEPFDRFVQKILPNEYRWLVTIKGKVYTKLYYLTKALFLFHFVNLKILGKEKHFLRQL